MRKLFQNFESLGGWYILSGVGFVLGIFLSFTILIHDTIDQLLFVVTFMVLMPLVLGVVFPLRRGYKEKKACFFSLVGGMVTCQVILLAVHSPSFWWCLALAVISGFFLLLGVVMRLAFLRLGRSMRRTLWRLRPARVLRRMLRRGVWAR